MFKCLICFTPVFSACNVESLSLLISFYILICMYYEMRYRYVMVHSCEPNTYSVCVLIHIRNKGEVGTVKHVEDVQ